MHSDGDRLPDGGATDAPTVLLTGATNGIGAEAAVDLGDRGWRVLVHGRDRERGDAVVARVRDAGGEAAFLRADFTDPEGVRDLAADVRERTDGLEALVLNAGLSRSECRLAWDGVEETFAVNQLAPYLLTHELADVVRTSATRVVVTSSAVHSRGELDFDGPSELDCSGDYDAIDAYARSKLANLLFAVELADRLEGTGATVTAYHPGFVPGSGLYRHARPLYRVALGLVDAVPLLGTTVEEGAAGIPFLVDDDAVADATGAYFHGTERKRPDARVEDPERRDLVWSVCADLAGVDPDWP